MTVPDFNEQQARIAQMKALYPEWNPDIPSIADFEGAGWEHPLDPFAQIDPPMMDIDLHLPEPVRGYVREESTNIGVDPGAIGLNVLVALASCIDSRLRIQPKRHDHRYTVSARLWGMVVGGPSDKKSPAQNSALRPLKAIQSNWARNNAEQARLAKENGEAPPLQRNLLLTGDTTVEGLAKKLSLSEPRGIMIVRDELAGWFGSMDAYNSGAGKDKAAWLEIWNGQEYSVTRASKDDQFVECWGANIVGNIQPSVIARMVSKMENDGMMARFIVYCMQPSNMGRDVAPDDQNYFRYAALANWLTTLEPGTVKLSEEAHVLREDLERTIFTLAHVADSDRMKGVIGKWQGISYALMLLYHCCECFQDGLVPQMSPLSPDSVNRAISMIQLMFSHSSKFYGEIDPQSGPVQQLANLLLTQNQPEFTVKRFFGRFWKASRAMTYLDQREVLARLEALNWIEPAMVIGQHKLPVYEKVDEQRRPEKYLVNPKIYRVYTKQAIQEKERRHEIRQLLIGLKG